MIYDKIENAPRYMGISPALDAALRLIQGPIDRLPVGRQEDGLGVYHMVSDTPLKPLIEARWEAHRQYADIQIGFEPGELIGVMPLDDLEKPGPYDAGRDILFADDDAPGVQLPLTPGMFAVFFPTDAHRPCIAADGVKTVRKLVVKVPV